MTSVARITSKGQVTLPAELRAEYGAEPGDEIVFFKDLAGVPRFLIRRRRNLALEPLFAWTGAPVPVSAMDPGKGEESGGAGR
jgi:AbrB family looped-hinge helix DNA binding protein